MTFPASSSAETYQATIPAEADRASIPPDADSKPTPQDGVAANVPQDAIESLENLASRDRPLAELLDEAKRLLDTSNPEPNLAAHAKSEANEKPRLAEIEQETSGRLSRQAETANPLRRSGHASRIWRRVWLKILAVLAAVVVGCAFGYVVARNDRPMQIFFSAAVAMGLSLVFSAFATQLNRRQRGRHG
jgi:hypothetical protein